MTLDSLLAPASVAVVGVGRTPGGVGRSTFDNLLAAGFPGPVFAVNPRVASIDGRVSYPDVASLPETPDLVIIAIPAAAANEVVRQCGERGVGAVIVLSAGFKETGPAGAALEREVVATARAAGIRLLGPNCLGALVPGARLNATFARDMPPDGGLALLSQSGALGTAVLDWARTFAGLSAFVSFGNRADISESDLMDWLANHDRTRVVAGYLESVADGPHFVRAASALSRRKPVVFLKAGGSEAGARAVSSHTGSLAGSDAAYDAALHAAGVLRARDVEELFGLAEAFAKQPIPIGPGVAILTNAGGPAVLATDACDREGVELASLDAATIAELRAAMPAGAALYNPVDILGDADAARYSAAAEILLRDPGVHALLVLLTPQAPTQPVETASRIARLSQDAAITTLASFMGEEAVEDARRVLSAAGIPAFRYPERAVESLAGMHRYARLASRPTTPVPTLDADRAAVRGIIDDAKRARRPFILEEHAAEIARAYGIPVPASGLARDRHDARRLAAEIGYPVALKIASPDILHKTDIGGIALGIADESALDAAWESIVGRARWRMPDAEVWGALVQKMLPPGRELIIGVERDPTFGPLLMFGLGGVWVEIMRDVAFRLCPLGRDEALALLQEIKAYGLLRGARGQVAADLDAIADVIVRVSALAADFPEIVELDINPLIAFDRGQGAVAADIRIGIGG
jgi:acetate---CoA ligase (ADP-forming)